MKPLNEAQIVLRLPGPLKDRLQREADRQGMSLFTLTFQIITEESAANGDYSSCGLITRPGNSPNRSLFGLREAIAIFRNFYDGSGPVEADCSPISKETPPRWFNTCNQGFNSDGENVNVSLHIPKEVSPSSAMRLARYLRCHGLTRP